MSYPRRKKYIKHVFMDLRKIKESFVKSTKPDRVRMFVAMKPFIDNLLTNGIYKLQNLVQILKENGLDSNSMINFMAYLEEVFNKKNIINNRERKKANQTEKNIFFNSMCFDYPDQIQIIIVDYMVRYANVKNRKSLHDLIKSKIDNILEQAKNSNSLDINADLSFNKRISDNNNFDRNKNDEDMLQKNIFDETFELDVTDLFNENPNEPIFSKKNEKIQDGAKAESNETPQVLNVIEYNDDDFFFDDECQSPALYY